MKGILIDFFFFRGWGFFFVIFVTVGMFFIDLFDFIFFVIFRIILGLLYIIIILLFFFLLNDFFVSLGCFLVFCIVFFYVMLCRFLGFLNVVIMDIFDIGVIVLIWFRVFGVLVTFNEDKFVLLYMDFFFFIVFFFTIWISRFIFFIRFLGEWISKEFSLFVLGGVVILVGCFWYRLFFFGFFFIFVCFLFLFRGGCFFVCDGFFLNDEFFILYFIGLWNK